ncbi:hypothetical protein K438DRAFT_1801683 [Mycena galopus ATCC 62051]|nr:hypothetical protein K438DRAFT_1801683 [Mycena galopus ATCC 62051]
MTPNGPSPRARVQLGLLLPLIATRRWCASAFVPVGCVSGVSCAGYTLSLAFTHSRCTCTHACPLRSVPPPAS